MALDSKNNIKSVFIVPDLAASAAGTKITPGSLGAGFIAVCGLNNEILTAAEAAAADTIKIIKDRGVNLPLQQVRISLSEVKTLNGVTGAAASEQITYIGYNGTTGSMPNTIDTFYEIKLEHVPNAFAYGKRPANYKYGTYQSGSTTSQVEITTGLVKSLVQNFVPNRTTDWRVFSEVVTNATRTAVSGAGTLKFTKYSKTVVASAATASSTFVVGDYIQIAAGNTNGVYKIVDKDGSGNLTLDYAFQGETTTITPGVLAIRITVANAGIATSWGVKITGIKQKYDVNRWRQYDKVRFNPFINSGLAGTLVTTTAAFDGIGVYEQAANDEYISWGDEGQIFVDQVPPQFREQDAQSGVQYNPAILSWVSKLPSLIGAGENKGSAIFYIVNKTTANQGVTLVDRLAQFASQNAGATFTWS
jgi:hypothetical protein